VFACALLNSMPMGFYQPAQIIIDAEKHGVNILPIDINDSDWDNKLDVGLQSEDKYFNLRLGFRQIKGLSEKDLEVLVAARKKRYATIQELREAGVSGTVLEMLADADAFRSIELDRRSALWELITKDQQVNALFSSQSVSGDEEQKIVLPAMRLSEHVIQDYATTSFSLKAHPVSFVRAQLESLHAISNVALLHAKAGTVVKVAGLVLVRQRPGTASGICFITIEDETGVANLVVVQKLFDRYRKEIIQSRLLMVEGTVQREGEVIHVIVKRCYNVSVLLGQLTETDEGNLSAKPSRSDETTSPFLSKSKKPAGEPIQGLIFPEGRNFR